MISRPSQPRPAPPCAFSSGLAQRLPWLGIVCCTYMISLFFATSIVSGLFLFSEAIGTNEYYRNE